MDLRVLRVLRALRVLRVFVVQDVPNHRGQSLVSRVVAFGARALNGKCPVLERQPFCAAELR